MSIITISREVGSFGDEIAKRAAGKLNFKLADRNHIHELVKECDLEFNQACRAFEDEVRPHRFLERLSFSNPAYTARFMVLNYELAEEGSVVIVGRGAQIPLAEVPGVLKVRIVAPEEIRVARISERMGLSKQHAVEYVKSYGRERRSLMESIYPMDLYDLHCFDLVVNTAVFSVDQAVEIIIGADRMIEGGIDAGERSKKLKLLAFGKDVESRIKKRISTMPSRDITVEAGENGVVTLNGLVQTRRNKETAEKIAAEVPGVTEVISNLKTTQLSF